MKNKQLLNFPDRCKGNTQHPATKPSFICLHADCYHRRLLCDLCVKQQRHAGHVIAYINERVDPFSKLSINCHSQDAKNTYKLMHQKAINFDRTLKKIQKDTKEMFERIRQKLVNPLFTIAGTYNSNMMQQSIQIIENHPENLDAVEQISERINYLIRHQHLTNNLKYYQILEQNSMKILTQGSFQIKKSLQNMENKVQSIFKSDDPFKQVSKLDKFQSKVSQSQLDMLLKLKHQSQLSKVKYQSMIPERLISQKIQNKKQHQSNNMKSQNEEIKHNKPKSRKIKFSMKQKSVVFPSQGDSAIISKNNVEMQEQAQKTQKIYNEWIICPQNSISQLSSSQLKQIKTLQITHLQSEPRGFFSKLKKMSKLQTIRVSQTLISSQKHICDLVQALPRSIKRIYFNCSNDLNKRCIEIMTQKQLNKLQTIQYYYDIENRLRYLDESLFFKLSDQGIRVQSLDYETVNFMAQCFPYLKNCWLKAKNFKPGRKAVHIKYHTLESLVVGQIQDSKTYKTQTDHINSHLVNAITQTCQLRCLVLLNIQIVPQTFQLLVNKNKMLHTLVVESCQGVTQSSLQKLTFNNQLGIVNYSIKDCPQVKGSFIQNVPKVQIFIIDNNVFNEDIESSRIPFSSLEKCNSLQYLNMYGNPFMNDNLLSTLSSSKHSLKSLNIGCTCITETSVLHISQFTQLDTLIIDENILSTKAIFQICSSLPLLEKLSLCGFNGKKKKGQLSAQLLKEIGLKLPNLTHLMIRDCCYISDSFDLSNFPKLKIVELDRSAGSYFVSSLKCAGLKVIDQSSSDLIK